ncbi:transcription factor subunit Med10 of mediator complex-domain-containing protein [Halteromyces radiatus]|uniref:transcription factor subunit Med10 of mediator complex-domain-containing protein n=1 Tax=Halteromyces radiatus TaxID=101107 RepID=UPI00221EF6AF|nr:transcription factor subunit Med10 of mediator complex-domain-containing protein [Halteromyces radiatus]KAI8098623.1 transcription factor subunit Med10 of mediator complex-domain-containing protein [Halteromyces radiatus]
MQEQQQHHDTQSPSQTLPNTVNDRNDEREEETTDDTRQEVEEQLHDLLQVLFELSVMVYDFQPDGNKLVWNKINSVLDHYKTIDQLKNGLNEFIPEEVISYVENGKNPDLFTQAFTSRTASENQFTHGKIKAVENFRSLLSDEFAKSFPDLYENNNDLNAHEQQQQQQQQEGEEDHPPSVID